MLNLTSPRPHDTPGKVPVQPARNLGGGLGQGVQPGGCTGARWGHRLRRQTPQFSLASLYLGGGYLPGRSREEGAGEGARQASVLSRGEGGGKALPLPPPLPPPRPRRHRRREQPGR